MKIVAYGFEASEIGEYRLREPMKELERQALAEVRTTDNWRFPRLTPRPDWKPEEVQREAAKANADCAWADVLFTQRYIHSSAAVGLGDIVEKAEIPWVLDIDDHVMALDPHMQAAPTYRDMHPTELGDARPIESEDEVGDNEICMKHTGTGEMMAVKHNGVEYIRALTHYQIMGADGLIVATRPMLYTYQNMRRKEGIYGSCFYIPYCVRAAAWQGLPDGPDHGDEVWFGWLGADGHENDLRPLVPIIQDVLERYPQTRFFWKRSNVPGLHSLARRYPERCVKFARWVPREEWPRYYALTGLDIVLAPLKSTPFNDCRSPMKWVEAAMLKKACLCARTPGYEDAVKNHKTGMLCARPKNWARALEDLIENPAKRREIGERAHEVALKTHTFEANAHLYVEALEKVKRREPCVTATP